MVLGCDVSKYQGFVDWTQKKIQGYEFTIIKATEGSYDVDPQFITNALNAPLAGLSCGAYHFFHPNQDALSQATLFLKTLGGLKLRAALDWEVSDNMRIPYQISQAQIWLDAVEHATGVVPIVYSYSAYFKQLNLPKSFARYPLWLAEYSSSYSSPSPWQGVNDAIIWQNSGSNGLDHDQFIGDLAAMKAFFG